MKNNFLSRWVRYVYLDLRLWFHWIRRAIVERPVSAAPFPGVVETPLEGLSLIRDTFLEDPYRWTRHSFRRDIDGNRVYSGEDPTSVHSCCLLGAFDRVAPDHDAKMAMRRHIKTAITTHYNPLDDDIAHFNDTATYPRIVMALEHAIAEAEARETGV